MKSKIREDVSAAPLDLLSFDSRGFLGSCVSNLLVHLLSSLVARAFFATPLAEAAKDSPGRRRLRERGLRL